MYGWIWRHLPGPLAVRLGQVVLLLVAAVALLFFVVFPRVEPLLPYSDVTVAQPTGSPSSTPSGTPTDKP